MGDVLRFPGCETCVECGGAGFVGDGADGVECSFCDGAGLVPSWMLTSRHRHPSNQHPDAPKPPA